MSKPIHLDDLHPLLIHEIPLEKRVEGMSVEEKKAFYKGFSSCLKLTISGLSKDDGCYILPKDAAALVEKLADHMIDLLKLEDKVAEAIAGKEAHNG